MYNSLNRIQNTFGFFTTVAFVLACFIALSDFITPRAPSAGTIVPEAVQVVKGRPHYYSSKKEEYAIIKFSLEASLESLFTWNTKQVFIYVTAEWPEPGTENVTNSAVIWDQIITSPSADHLSNLSPVALRKLKRSAEGKSIDPSRYVVISLPLTLSRFFPPLCFAAIARTNPGGTLGASSKSRTKSPNTKSPTLLERWPRPRMSN